MTARVNRRRLLVMADQGVSSLSNVLVSIFAARLLTPDGFGAFGVAVIAYLLTVGTSRAFIGEPLLSQHSDWAPEDRSKLLPDMMGAAVVAGVAAATAVGIVGLVIRGASGSALTALALVLPLMLVQDAWRYAFVIDRPGAALAVDVAWLVGVCAALPLAPDDASTAWFVVAWGLAAGVGAALGWSLAREHVAVPSPGRWFADHREMGARFFGELVTGQAVSQVVLIGLGALGGLTALGAVRAAQVFYGPINTVHAGVYLALVPEGAQVASQPRRMRRLMVRASVLLASVSLGWMGVGLLLPRSWGEALFGSTWAEATELILPVGLAVVAGSLMAGGFSGVRSLGAASDSLRARLRSVPALVLLPLCGAGLAGGAGYAAGLGVAQLIAAVIWWSVFLRALSRRATRVRVRAVLEAVSF